MSAERVVWGIDPSTVRVAIAWAGRSRGVEARSFRPSLSGGERLWHIYADTFALCRHLFAEVPPSFVLIEQPFGKNVPPVSYLAMGAIMTACWRVTGAPVMPVAVPTWKKEAMGKGNARKPEIMAWARANGYRGALQDAADAWGIATAALVLAGGRDA